MYNSIIFSKDLETLKKMYNIIFKNLDNSCINLTQLITNEEDLFNLEEDLNLIIFSDFEITNKNIVPLIKKFENKIIFTKDISKYRNSKCILYLPLEPQENYTYEKLSEFVLKHNRNFINKKVYSFLKELNLDFKYIGSYYILEGITYAYMHKDEYLFENLEKNIYPYLSQVYKTSVENIKWGVIRALEFFKINPAYKNLFTLNVNYKFTPKLFFTQIMNFI